jgi:hypothetical protein
MSNVRANKCEIDEALWKAYRRSDKREVTANLLSRWLAAVELMRSSAENSEHILQRTHFATQSPPVGTLEHGLTISHR